MSAGLLLPVLLGFGVLDSTNVAVHCRELPPATLAALEVRALAELETLRHSTSLNVTCRAGGVMLELKLHQQARQTLAAWVPGKPDVNEILTALARVLGRDPSGPPGGSGDSAHFAGMNEARETLPTAAAAPESAVVVSSPTLPPANQRGAVIGPPGAGVAPERHASSSDPVLHGTPPAMEDSSTDAGDPPEAAVAVGARGQRWSERSFAVGPNARVSLPVTAETGVMASLGYRFATSHPQGFSAGLMELVLALERYLPSLPWLAPALGISVSRLTATGNVDATPSAETVWFAGAFIELRFAFEFSRSASISAGPFASYYVEPTIVELDDEELYRVAPFTLGASLALQFAP